MTANELRIGNYIYYPIGVPIKVDYHIIRAFFVINPHPDYLPIPITKELLLKCGFYTSDWDDNTSFRLQISDYYTLVVNLEFDTYELGDLDIRKITYLHELQNLYFILTGNELKINI